MTNRLEKLIHSLSSGELKSVSLAMKKIGNTKYQKLFNDIKKNKKKDVAYNKISNQRRKYLYDLIMKTISKNLITIESKIIAHILYTQTFYERHFINEAWKELHKALKLAEKYEKFSYIIIILEWKKRLSQFINTFIYEDIEELKVYQSKVLQLQSEFLDITDKYHFMLELSRKKHSLTNEEFESLLLNNYIDLNSSINNLSRMSFFQLLSQASYYWLNKNYIKQYEVTKKILKTKGYKVESLEYLQALFEHLSSCLCVAEFEEIIFTIKIIQTNYKNGLYAKCNYNSLKIFFYSAYELICYSYLGDINSLQKKIEEVEEGMLQWQDSSYKNMNLLLYTALKTAYYFIGDYKKTNYYLQKILSENLTTIRTDIANDAILFDFILTYETTDLVQYETFIQYHKSYIDTLEKNSFVYNVIKLLTDLINEKITRIYLLNYIKEEYIANGILLNNGRYFNEDFHFFYLWAISKLNKENIVHSTIRWRN